MRSTFTRWYMKQINLTLLTFVFIMFFSPRLFPTSIESHGIHGIDLRLHTEKPVLRLPQIAVEGEAEESDEFSVLTDLRSDPTAGYTELSLNLSFVTAPAEGTMPLVILGDRITITRVAVNLLKAADYYSPLFLEMDPSDNGYDYLKDLKDNVLYMYYRYMEPVGKHLKQNFSGFADDNDVRDDQRWTAIPWFAVSSAPKVIWDGICATIKESPKTVGRQFLVPYRIGYKTLIEGDTQGSQRILIDGYVNSIAANGSVAGVLGLSQVGARILVGGKNLLGNLSPNALELAGNNGLNISGIVGGGTVAEGSCVALGGISGDMLRTGAGTFFAGTAERSASETLNGEFDMENFIDRLEFIHGKGTYVKVTLEDGTTYHVQCIDILRPNSRNAMLLIREKGSHELTSLPFQVIKHAEVRLGPPSIKHGTPVKIWFKRGRSATGTYVEESAKEVLIQFKNGTEPMRIPKGDLLLQLTREAEL